MESNENKNKIKFQLIKFNEIDSNGDVHILGCLSKSDFEKVKVINLNPSNDDLINAKKYQIDEAGFIISGLKK